VDQTSQLFILLLLVVVALIVLLRRRSPPGRRPVQRSQGRARGSASAETFGDRSESSFADAGVQTSRERPLATPQPITARPPLPALREFTLLQADALPAEAEQELGRTLQSLEQPHPLLARMSSGLDDAEELAQVVRADPGLSAEVLRTVNSAAFALSTPIVSVNHALTFLGSNLVKTLVMHAAVAPTLKLETEPQRLAVDRVWRASYIASTVAQLGGAELGLPRPSVLATAALLGSLGDVALIARHPALADTYLQPLSLLDQVRAQQAVSGLNGALVAAALAREWELPEELSQMLGGLLLPMVCEPDALPVIGEERCQLLVCYSACRLGWWVVSQNLIDIDMVDLLALEWPEFHYLPQHLQAAGLEPLITLPRQPTFRNKVNQLLVQLQASPA